MSRRAWWPGGLAGATAAVLWALLVEGVVLIWMEQRRATTAAFEAGALGLAAIWFVRGAVRADFAFPGYRFWGSWSCFGAAPAMGLVQLAAGLTMSRWETVNAVLDWWADLAVMALCCVVFGRARLRGVFLRALVIFGFVLSAASVIGFLAASEQVFGVWTPLVPGMYLGAFFNRDHYAALMELLLPMSLFWGFTERRGRWVWLAMAGMMYGSVIAGASRAGSFLVTVEAVVTPLLVFRRRLMPDGAGKKLLAAMAICLVGFAAAAGWDFLWERLQMKDPVGDRREMLISTGEMIRARPWAGFGLGNFENAYPRYASFDDGELVTHAHDDWAEWCADLGIPAAALVLCGALWSIGPAVRTIWGIGALSALAHGMIDYPMHRPAVAFWTFAVLGMVWAQESAPESHGDGVTRRRKQKART